MCLAFIDVHFIPCSEKLVVNNILLVVIDIYLAVIDIRLEVSDISVEFNDTRLKFRNTTLKFRNMRPGDTNDFLLGSAGLDSSVNGAAISLLL